MDERASIVLNVLQILEFELVGAELLVAVRRPSPGEGGGEKMNAILNDKETTSSASALRDKMSTKFAEFNLGIFEMIL